MQREIDKERDRETQRETERDRERQRETERDRERQRETERDRERQRETGRHIGFVGDHKEVSVNETPQIGRFYNFSKISVLMSPSLYRNNEFVLS